MYKNIKLIPLLFIICSLNQAAFAKSFEKINLDQNVLYRYDFDTEVSQIELKKALDSGKIGLEDVYSGAKRHKAKAAFNGGFFHDSHAANGVPSWLFISDDILYAKESTMPSIYQTMDGEVKFAKIKSEIFINLKNGSIRANSINNPIEKGIRIFNSKYWDFTLSTSDFFEVSVEGDRIGSINENGNTKIPTEGFVISIEKTHKKDWAKIIKSQMAKYELVIHSDGKKIERNNIKWLMSGSDLLVKNSEVPSDITSKRNISAFRDEPHGRTAICQFTDTKFAVFVADHNPAANAYDLKMRDLIMPLKQQGLDRETALNMKTGDLLGLYNKSAESREISVGITLSKLAHYLKSIGCINAINLDGGGSSTLYVEGEIVNNPTGLQNKNVAGKNLRQVGDFFIIK